MRTSHGFVPVMSLALGLASGCATKQTVSLACVPEEYTVYVDGEILKGGYESIELRAGEPHKIYVKGPGHEPSLVVLEPRPDGEGRLRLEPADPCRVLKPVPLERDLVIEVEEPS